MLLEAAEIWCLNQSCLQSRCRLAGNECLYKFGISENNLTVFWRSLRRIKGFLQTIVVWKHTVRFQIRVVCTSFALFFLGVMVDLVFDWTIILQWYGTLNSDSEKLRCLDSDKMLMFKHCKSNYILLRGHCIGQL